MHYKVFVIIKMDPATKDKISGILDKNKNLEKKERVDLESMSFDEILNYSEKREPSEYEKLMHVLEKKVKVPLERYSNNVDGKNGKLEDWTATDILDPEKIVNEKVPDYYPEAIMTPDLRWLERSRSSNEKEDKEKDLAWNKLVKEILENNKKDSIILLVDCDV